MQQIHEKAIENLIRDGYDFDISDSIDRGSKIFTSNMGPFIGFTVLYMLISGSVSIFTSGLGSMLISGPLTAGYFIVANAIVRNEEIKFEMFFDGFKLFLPLFLLFVIFLKMDFWPAMEASRKIISKKFWSFFGFFILLGLINLLGIIALGVGVLFTIPATYCMMYAAFESVVGGAIREEQAKEQEQHSAEYTYTY